MLRINKMKHKLLGALIAIASILISCSQVEESAIEGMFPDYSDVTIPYNIAQERPCKVPRKTLALHA